MQPRRVARELALLGLSQLPTNPSKLRQKSWEDLLTAAVRTLSEEVDENLTTAAAEVQRSDRLMQESQQILPEPAQPAAQGINHVSPGESETILSRVRQIQGQLRRSERALQSHTVDIFQRQSELVGLVHQAQDSLATAVEQLSQLEQRLQSARQVLGSATQLTQEAINRMGVALSMPEWLQLVHSKEVQAFALELLTTLHRYREEVDQQLQTALVGWQLGRLSRIDRDVLRLATVELQFLGGPERVAINEAVELAKKYGNEDSAAFINGVLRRLVGRGGPGEVPPLVQPESPKPDADLPMSSAPRRNVGKDSQSERSPGEFPQDQ